MRPTELLIFGSPNEQERLSCGPLPVATSGRIVKDSSVFLYVVLAGTTRPTAGAAAT
jgi:hypothetical protein